MTRDPIDAQARGRLRLYKRKLAADYAAFDAVYKSITSTRVGDFMNKGDKGRRRIFDRIQCRRDPLRRTSRILASRSDAGNTMASDVALRQIFDEKGGRRCCSLIKSHLIRTQRSVCILRALPERRDLPIIG